MAIFAVLSLMVVFTVLGVAAITIAQRDNSSSGNVLDIKQREAAAYAGLVYAQNELARDPANLLAMLESWRTRTLYASPTGPFGPVYLKFDPTAAVALTTTDPGMYQIPGSTSKIKVEVTGITLPSSNQEPRIALRSTGSSASGDEQTILGVYQIKNIRMSSSSITMPLTHPFYVSGAGNWDNQSVTIDGGNAFFGGKTHVNGTNRHVILKSAGLRVSGDFELDDITEFTVDSSVYINGDFLIHQITGALKLKQNVIVTGNISPQSDGATLQLDSSLYLMGSPGFTIAKALRIVIGKDFYFPNGSLKLESGSWIDVGGSAYIRRFDQDVGKSIALDVGKRLELSGKGGARHQFFGTGNWGQLIVRNGAPGSTIQPVSFSSTYFPTRASTGLQVSNNPGPSWIANNFITVASTSNRLRLMPDSATTHFHTMGMGSPVYLTSGTTGDVVLLNKLGRPGAVSPSVDAIDGFDDGPLGPRSEAEIANGATRPTETSDFELGVDLSRDPTLVSRGWIATASSLCETPFHTCAKAIQNAYDANVSSRSQFYGEFFIVRLTGTKLGWDLGRDSATRLKGKFMFVVQGNYAVADVVWPTTAPNPNAKNPQNVIFIYARGKNYIFDGFSPRYKNNTTDPVEFTGYVRYDGDCSMAKPSMTPQAPLIINGALHVMGPPYNGTPGSASCQGLTINSGAAVTFKFDQAALDAVGSSLGTVFTKPDGTSLPMPPNQFLLMENWVQMRTLGELR